VGLGLWFGLENEERSKEDQSHYSAFDGKLGTSLVHSSTRQNIQSHCFNFPVSRPSRNYCFSTSQDKISISVNPWVFLLSIKCR